MGLPKPTPDPNKPPPSLPDFLLDRLAEMYQKGIRPSYTLVPSSFYSFTFIHDPANNIVKVLDADDRDITDVWRETMQKHEGPTDAQLVRIAVAQTKIVHRYQKLPYGDPERWTLHRVLCDLASVWSDHPDYNPSWR